MARPPPGDGGGFHSSRVYMCAHTQMITHPHTQRITHPLITDCSLCAGRCSHTFMCITGAVHHTHPHTHVYYRSSSSHTPTHSCVLQEQFTHSPQVTLCRCVHTHTRTHSQCDSTCAHMHMHTLISFSACAQVCTYTHMITHHSSQITRCVHVCSHTHTQRIIHPLIACVHVCSHTYT